MLVELLVYGSPATDEPENRIILGIKAVAIDLLQ
jgi:hypothetical protein